MDHFIPWSRYPADVGQNFVLAHTGCNNAKSDHAAAEDHLAGWVRRNLDFATKLRERLTEIGLPCDPAATERVARWVYYQTERANGQMWVEHGVLRPLGPRWSDCFGG